jgi:hypothetical protein
MSFTLPEPAEILALLNTPNEVVKANFNTWIREWLRIDPDRVAQLEIQNKIKQLDIPHYDAERFDDWIEWIRSTSAYFHSEIVALRL